MKADTTPDEPQTRNVSSAAFAIFCFRHVVMRMHVIGQTRRIPNFVFRIANFEFRMSLLGFRMSLSRRLRPNSDKL